MADGVGDFGDEAFDVEIFDDLLKDAAIGFALGGAFEFQGDGDFDLFVEAHAGEVHVDDFHAQVVVLDFLDEDFFVFAVEGEVEEVGAAVEMIDDFLFGERDGDDGFFVAVDDPGQKAGIAEAFVGAAAEFGTVL